MKADDIGAAARGADATIERVHRVFERQHAAARREPAPEASARERHLDLLRDALLANVDAIAQAISADFGHRSPHETRLLEIFPGLQALDYARRRLRRWMRAQPRPVSFWFRPARARVVWQPLGAVGIIVPWNYPIYLSIAPLTCALAAGNRVMVKMSELTPATGELLARLVAERFAEDHVAIFNGGPEVARAFAARPFDHLLFTGSAEVGRSVMASASANLTPVTLELGGKSPAIVAPDYPIEAAAQRILTGKCMNAGQTCIATDYVLLPEGREQEFVAAARAFVARCYPTLAHNPDYTAIVDRRHYLRLRALLDDAQGRGARLVELNPAGEALPEETRKIAPTLVLGAPDDARIMREEIFGPLLPLISYDSLDAAIAFVNARPRPLALYYFDHDRGRIERVLRETVSGGVTVNDTVVHIAQEALPFGGVGASGMGSYHGHDGFAAFSKKKGVLLQSRLSALALLRPPYGARFQRIVRLLLR